MRKKLENLQVMAETAAYVDGGHSGRILKAISFALRDLLDNPPPPTGQEIAAAQIAYEREVGEVIPVNMKSHLRGMYEALHAARKAETPR